MLCFVFALSEPSFFIWLCLLFLISNNYFCVKILTFFLKIDTETYYIQYLYLKFDSLRGGNGSDILRGNGGNDVLRGNNGSDFPGGGFGNDLLLGGNGKDNLNGSIGSDTLNGGFGDDTLQGGLGNDFLTGGAGADSFVLAAGQSGETITDFEDDIDKFILDGDLSFGNLDILSTGNETVIINNNTILAVVEVTPAFIISVEDFIFDA